MAGQRLEMVVQAVQALVRDVPPVANGAAAAQAAAVSVVSSELEGLRQLIARDASDAAALSRVRSLSGPGSEARR